MERTINTKFFTFSQNNSGGSFYRNDMVREFVVVEAQNAKEANSKFDEISYNYSDSCPCCGSRWYEVDEDEGSDKPMGYGEPFTNFYADKKWHRGYTIVVYYYDGTKRFFNADGDESGGDSE